MDSILPIFYIILVVILAIWGILFLWRTSMTIRLMDSFSQLPSRVEYVVRIQPPLVIEDAALDRALDVVDEALGAVAAP